MKINKYKQIIQNGEYIGKICGGRVMFGNVGYPYFYVVLKNGKRIELEGINFYCEARIFVLDNEELFRI